MTPIFMIVLAVALINLFICLISYLDGKESETPSFLVFWIFLIILFLCPTTKTSAPTYERPTGMYVNAKNNVVFLDYETSLKGVSRRELRGEDAMSVINATNNVFIMRTSYRTLTETEYKEKIVVLTNSEIERLGLNEPTQTLEKGE